MSASQSDTLQHQLGTAEGSSAIPMISPLTAGIQHSTDHQQNSDDDYDE